MASAATCLQRGGWASADAADRFEAYVAIPSRIVGDVPWVCTINEPNMIALLTGMPERAAARAGKMLPHGDSACRGREGLIRGIDTDECGSS